MKYLQVLQDPTNKYKKPKINTLLKTLIRINSKDSSGCSGQGGPLGGIWNPVGT